MHVNSYSFSTVLSSKAVFAQMRRNPGGNHCVLGVSVLGCPAAAPCQSHIHLMTVPTRYQVVAWGVKCQT